MWYNSQQWHQPIYWCATIPSNGVRVSIDVIQFPVVSAYLSMCYNSQQYYQLIYWCVDGNCFTLALPAQINPNLFTPILPSVKINFICGTESRCDEVNPTPWGCTKVQTLNFVVWSCIVKHRSHQYGTYTLIILSVHICVFAGNFHFPQQACTKKCKPTCDVYLFGSKVCVKSCVVWELNVKICHARYS